jgi:hypothetical protein
MERGGEGGGGLDLASPGGLKEDCLENATTLEVQ